MVRKLISAFALGAGALLIVIGANEADYQATIGQVGYRWLEYLIAGSCFMTAGAVLRKVIKC